MMNPSKLLILAIAFAACQGEFKAGRYAGKDAAMESGPGMNSPSPDLGVVDDLAFGGRTGTSSSDGGREAGSSATGGTGPGADAADAPFDGGNSGGEHADVAVRPYDAVATGGVGGSGGTPKASDAGSAGATGAVDAGGGRDIAIQIDARWASQDAAPLDVPWIPDAPPAPPGTAGTTSQATVLTLAGSMGTGGQGGVQTGGSVGTGGTTATSGTGGTAGTAGTGGASMGGSTGVLAQTLERYLILMDDQFLGNSRLQELIEWKAEKGYDVRVVTTAQIAADGAPSHQQVVDYMRGLPAAEYPRYLLIIGDADAKNGVAALKFQSAGVPPEYANTDPYPQQYTDRELMTKTPGGLPTVFAGRLPASTPAELDLMLDKVLLMDRSPPSPTTTAMYDHVLLAGELFPVQKDGQYVDSGTFAEMQDAAISYFQQAGKGTTYKVDTALVQETTLPEGAEVLWYQDETRLWKGAAGTSLGARVLGRYLTGSDAAQRGLNVILDSVNAGTGMMLFIGRAGTNGWWRPPFTSSEIASKLHNGSNLPLVISDASLAGVYYPPTGDVALSPGEPFAKSLLTCPNGGAYAVIGATDMLGTTSMMHGILMAFLGDYRDWMTQTADPAFASPLPAAELSKVGFNAGEATRLGQILTFAKRYAGADAHYHLLGDPEASLLLHPPVAQTVLYPARTLPGASQSITVFTGEDGAQVSLVNRELGIRAVGTTRNGLATLSLPASTEGIVKVTVTRYGRMPYRGLLTITRDILRGDVDGDGKVEADDANMIASTTAGLPVYDMIREAADANCDGKININDALVVGQLAQGITPVTSCGPDAGAGL